MTTLTATPLTEGSVYRCAKKGSDPLPGESRKPHAEAFIFNALTDADDHRGHAGRLALSSDWREHKRCGEPVDCLKRMGGDFQEVWQLPIEQLLEPFSVGKDAAREELAMHVFHWPETKNEAHAHLLMVKGKTTSKYKTVSQLHVRRICEGRLVHPKADGSIVNPVR